MRKLASYPGLPRALRGDPLARFVRFEGPDAEGIFAILSCTLDRIALSDGRVSRKALREIEDLTDWLRRNTPAVVDTAYRDQLSRRPRTWFKLTAVEHVRVAWRACVAMNALGVRVKPILARRLSPLLYEDSVQVVTRAHRTPAPPPVRPRSPGNWNGDRRTIRRTRGPKRAGLRRTRH